MSFLRTLRKDRALSQSELAEALGVSQPFIAQIESGNRSIPSYLVVPLSEALGVDPSQLIPASQTLSILKGLEVRDLTKSAEGRVFLLRLVKQILEAGDVSFAESVMEAVNETNRRDAGISRYVEDLRQLPVKKPNRKEGAHEPRFRRNDENRRYKKRKLGGSIA